MNVGRRARARPLARPLALAAAVALAALVGVVAVAGRSDPSPASPGHAAHGSAGAGAVTGEPARHTGPQGRVGQFVVACTYSHSAAADPIVHPGAPGRSHQHDFFGAVAVDASTTAPDLLGQETTCDKRADTAAYWHPTLYDGGEAVRPDLVQAYYRAAPGVDATRVEPFPFGLELVAGDPAATAPTGSEAAGWTCGGATRLHAGPPACPASAPLHLVLTFPDCWDGEHVRSDDHRSHAAYSAEGTCPASHPVHVPQLTVSVKYPISGAGHDLSLSSGTTHSAHGDFLNGWDPDGLAREVAHCIHRDVVCDLASNRAEEPLFAAR